MHLSLSEHGRALRKHQRKVGLNKVSHLVVVKPYVTTHRLRIQYYECYKIYKIYEFQRISKKPSFVALTFRNGMGYR